MSKFGRLGRRPNRAEPKGGGGVNSSGKTPPLIREVFIDQGDTFRIVTREASKGMRRVLAAWRHGLRIVGIAMIPAAIAQSLAFTSFIYEEALQATAFAGNFALQADDAPAAQAAIRRLDKQMREAQQWEDRFGKFCPWAHPAFASYFGVSVPAQVTAMTAKGAAKGFWKPDTDRFIASHTRADGNIEWIDRWKEDPIAVMQSRGFKVSMMDEAMRLRFWGKIDPALLDDFRDTNPEPVEGSK